MFIEKLKRFKNWSPYKISLITLFGCVIVNSPVFLWNYIKSDEEFYQGASNLETFTYCGRTDFVNSRLGFILSSISLVLRDLITLIFEIVLNIFTTIYYNKFIKKKLELSISNNTQNNVIVPAEIRLFFTTIIMSLISLLCHIFSSISTFVLINHDLDTVLIYSIILVSISSAVFKQSSNFFIFLIFDSNFRSSLIKYFKN